MREEDEESKTTKSRGVVRGDTKKGIQRQDQDQRMGKMELGSLRSGVRRDAQE